MFQKIEKSLVHAKIQSQDCSAPSLFAVPTRLSWLLRVIKQLSGISCAINILTPDLNPPVQCDRAEIFRAAF
jgi:hypothetical protein